MIVVIPAYEPDEKLLGVLKDFSEHTDFDLVVVDDGSSEACASVFAAAETFPRVKLLRHPCNMGKGAALKTAFTYIEQTYPRSEGLITVDADGQHLLKDALRVVAQWQSHPGALVTGSRRFTGNVPLRSRLGNSITRFVFHISTGTKVFDTQTGLRAFSVARISEMLPLSGNRYEYEINQLLYCTRNDIPILEVPIETVYIEENKSSHFHAVKDSFRIYKTIFLFFSSSLLSFVIDYVAFLLLALIFGKTALNTETQLLFATLGARILSALCNYLFNRFMVFDAKKAQHSFSKYVVLSVGVYLAQYLLLLGASVIGIPEWIGYVIVQIVIYPLTFLFQRIFVFSQKQKKADPLKKAILLIDLIAIAVLCGLLLLNAFGIIDSLAHRVAELIDPPIPTAAPPQEIRMTPAPTSTPEIVDFLFGDSGTPIPDHYQADYLEPKPTDAPYIIPSQIVDAKYLDRFSQGDTDADANTAVQDLGDSLLCTFLMQRSREKVSFDVYDAEMTFLPLSSNQNKRVVVFRIVNLFIRDMNAIRTVTRGELPDAVYVDEFAEACDALAAISGLQYSADTPVKGLIVRNGELVHSDEDSSSDLCLLLNDGTVQIYPANTYEFSDLPLEEIWQSFPMGLSLLDENGAPLPFDPDDSARRNSHNVLGYFGPGHYCLLTVMGTASIFDTERVEHKANYRGASEYELSLLCQKLGLEKAYLLESGRSATLWTDGQMFGHNITIPNDVIIIQEP